MIGIDQEEKFIVGSDMKIKMLVFSVIVTHTKNKILSLEIQQPLAIIFGAHRDRQYLLSDYYIFARHFSL